MVGTCLTSDLLVYPFSNFFAVSGQRGNILGLMGHIVSTEIFCSSKKAAKDDIQINICQRTLMLLLILQPTATITNKQNSYFSFPNISKMRDQTLGVCGQNQSVILKSTL